MSAYYSANKAKIQAQQKEYRVRNKDKIKAYYDQHKEQHKEVTAAAREAKKERLSHEYGGASYAVIARLERWGITPEIYARLVDEQQGKCRVCGEVKTLVFDHCHNTERLRGMLCGSCNNGLGFFKDSVEDLEKAIAYLRSPFIY